MNRAALPSHLAHKSALAVVLAEEESSLAYHVIQGVRQAHDKSYHRWPPHINLLYPFLAGPSRQIDDILARITDAVGDLPAFPATFSELNHFTHSKKSATLFLEPDAASTASKLKQLQAALEKAFPECNHDTRPFVPHLTLGQASGGQAVQSLAHLVDVSFQDEIAPAAPADDAEDLFNELTNSIAFHKPSGSDPFGKQADRATPWILQWTIRRVVVLERQGFEDPFEIVGQVDLK
ncbi:hypothetical protein LEN26_016268 [Aphanomyces euteiches]|nr:hypothetical protein LEN26_016268 [Aphanomyces euteiches]KAH9124009.1 hypothetical protein AeMF1_005149 [Aphanomyces euteiches]